MKICFKLSQTLGKSPFPGWNQLFNSRKSWSRDGCYIEYPETYRYHQNPWFSLIFVSLVRTSVLDGKERPTKTRQNMKICFKLSQTLGKSLFPGWNQLFNSLKSWSREDRYVEYLEIHGFPQNAWFSRISKTLVPYMTLYTTKAGTSTLVLVLKKHRLTWNFGSPTSRHVGNDPEAVTSVKTKPFPKIRKFWIFKFSIFCIFDFSMMHDVGFDLFWMLVGQMWTIWGRDLHGYAPKIKDFQYFHIW